jgi:hypothetical protein
LIDFTGDENDYVVLKDIYEQYGGSETPKKVGDALTKMGIEKDLKRWDGKPRLIRLGIKLKDFEDITEEYGDDISAELSFASTDAEMVSPMRNKSYVVEIEKLKTENNQLKEGLAYIQKAIQNETGPGPFTQNKMKLALEASLAEAENTKLIDEITALTEATALKEAPNFVPEEPELQMLRDEITELKQTLERQNLSSREEEEEVTDEEEEDPLLIPEVSNKKIDQLL